MKIALTIAAIWIAVSIPTALIMGRLFAVCGRNDPRGE